MHGLTWERLEGELADPIDALDLFERVFALCQSHQVEINDYRNRAPIRMLENDARDAVAERCVELRSGHEPLSGTRLAVEVVRTVREAQPNLPAAVGARALLWGLSDGAHQLIWSGLRTRGDAVIAPGQCFPVPLTDYKARLQACLGPDPAPALPPNPSRRLRERSDAVPGFDLADDALIARFELRFIFRFATAVDRTIGDGLPTFATVHPHTSTWNELVPAHFEVRTEEGSWFWAGPTGDGHIRKSIDLLAGAAACGATIAVLPELSQSDASALLTACDRPVPGIVVTGSSHAERASEHVGDPPVRVNAGALCIDGAVAIEHRKFRPFSLKAPEGELREDITVPARPTLSFVCAPDWTLTMLICADANDGDTVETLRHVGANIVLVPSWTSKRGYFGPHLGFLASGDTQAIVVVANGPADVEQPTPAQRAPAAMFFTPWASDGPDEVMDASPSGLVCFEPASRRFC